MVTGLASFQVLSLFLKEVYDVTALFCRAHYKFADGDKTESERGPSAGVIMLSSGLLALRV